MAKTLVSKEVRERGLARKREREVFRRNDTTFGGEEENLRGGLWVRGGQYPFMSLLSLCAALKSLP